MDTTYNVNIEGYPLFAIMAEDGDGRGKPVAYCFLRSETKDNLEKVLNYFCNFNDTSRTKIVMVDKDLSVINVLKSKLPDANILLCKFHVMKYFKKKISELDCKNIERQEIAELIQKIINSQSQADYDTLHEKLQDTSPEFLDYFNSNWHTCQELWVMHHRSTLRTHGNNTNNKIESHNQKLKHYVSKHMPLPKAIQHLDKFLDDTYSKSSFNRYANLKTKIDVRNTDKDILQYSLLCNSKAFQIVNDEYRMLDSINFEAEEENDSYTVKYNVKGSSFSISVSKSMNDCSCLTFCNFGLPCRHIFACRKQFKNDVYDEKLIPDRWRKEFEKQEGSGPIFTVQTSNIVKKTPLKQQKQPKSVIEKFNKAYDLCRDIAQFLSTCGDKEFQEKLSHLISLKSEWQCTQLTKEVVTDCPAQPDSIPFVADEPLTRFQYDNVKTTSMSDPVSAETNRSDESDDLIKGETVLETGEGIVSIPALGQNETTSDLDLDEIQIDHVKSRRGRPKGTKKPFWNFSKRSSVMNKKRKAADTIENISKKVKSQEKKVPNLLASQNDNNRDWITISKLSLKLKDKDDLEKSELLNDKTIDVAHEIMKTQFANPKINGFQSVLNKQRNSNFNRVEKDMVQILHRGSMDSGHWFTISTLNCPEGIVNVFDSMYSDLDQESKSQILSILKHEGKFVKFHMIPVQRQVGGTECGVFAIAFAVALSFGLNPTKLIFDQSKMRTHLITCLSQKQFSNFPFSINTNWKKRKQINIKENIFCSCRGLYDSEMIQCTVCLQWWHIRCIDKPLTISIQAFKCSQCN